jgi:hypothetical protein
MKGFALEFRRMADGRLKSPIDPRSFLKAWGKALQDAD